ncbi:MAG: VWA-like domain-containing protein [Georgfuchsia sp.]
MSDITETALAKLRQAKTNLVLDHPFFGALVMRLGLIPDPTCETLWVNGKVIGFNPGYVMELTMNECKAGLAHEVLHAANGHTWRRGTRDPERWNEAADYAINPILKNAGFAVPDDWLLDPKFTGKSVESIYEQLPRKNKGGGGNGSGKGQGSNQVGAQPSSSPHKGPGEVRDLPNPDTKAEQAANWKVAVSQAAKVAKMRGTLPGGLEWLVDDTEKSRIDWQSILHRFVKTPVRGDYDWRYPNTRYLSLGLYLPSLRSEEMGDIVIGIDTSGSTGSWMSAFFAELTSVVEDVRPRQVHVVYIDARIQRVDQFEQGDAISFSPKGGGGTDFRPFFQWVKDKDINPVCAVYLTDLKGTFPSSEPAYPVLFAGPIKCQAPFGEVVMIDERS